MVLAAPAAVFAAERAFPGLGQPLSQNEIQNFDRMIGPEGKELPAGRGTVKEGEAIFAKRCEVCHGKGGENGITHHLVAGQPGKPFKGPFYGAEKDGPSYFPYPTIAWDYINRAMPASNPGSLKPNEVYSLVAYLYYRNGIIKEGEAIFAKRCEICHGKGGENGLTHHLVAGQPGKPFKGPFYGVEKDGPSYFPYPTIAWDYINRAMPASNPGSLKTNEVYALVAYLYYRNGIIKETEVMDQTTLPKVVMPNKDGFVPAKPVYPPDPTKPSWY